MSVLNSVAFRIAAAVLLVLLVVTVTVSVTVHTAQQKTDADQRAAEQAMFDGGMRAVDPGPGK